MRVRWILLLVFLNFGFGELLGQAVSPLSKTISKLEKNILNPERRFFAGPYLNYTPETSWELGLAAFGFFNFGGADSLHRANTRPSTIKFNVARTLLRQTVVYLPYDIFLKDNSYYIHGEFGFYDYPYFFNGIGNTENPRALEEMYEASFPRIRINVQKKWGKHFYFGPKFYYQNTSVTKVNEGGLLDNTNVTGAQGGVNSGLGFLATYDSRNKLFFPTKGRFYQVSLLENASFLGSDFLFTNIITDFREYILLSETHRDLIALQLYNEFNIGEVPFNRLAQIGGSHEMRGYRRGWYRDKNMSILQAEYRSRLFWRFGMTLFGSVGWVANQANNYSINNTIPSGGLGFRWLMNEKEDLRFRLDFAWGRNSSGIYITVGEAF